MTKEERLIWILKEIIKMLSNRPSFFSYKRFQTSTAYIIFCIGAIYSLIRYVKTTEDFVMWCVPILSVCGYTLNQTQKEKLKKIEQ